MSIERSAISQFEGTLQYVVNRWRDADRRTLRHGFALLARGRPVSPELLAESAQVSAADAGAALRSGPVGLDDAGALVELFGVMLSPTLHRVEVSGRVIFTCCALVAHMLPAMLEQPLTVESVDPLNHRLMRLRVGPEGIEQVAPATTVVCFPTAPPADEPGNVREVFCGHAKHFADSATANEFAADHARRRVISLADADRLADELFQRIWSA